AMFNKMVKEYGNDVTVIYRTPQLDKDGNKIKDDKNHILFTEQTVQLRCKLRIMDGSENLLNNAVIEAGDAVAHFMLKDAQYLNKDSTLNIDYGNGIKYNFKMLKPIPLKTYINVQLKATG
ncbi:MAG: hypothetical protein K8E24_014100, partial [Methanobacterium paludis]|nr:hypothetical protein [Methanobacterium paludis]